MIRDFLPYSLYKVLFGDRKKYGLKKDLYDPDFLRWQDLQVSFYEKSQKKGIGGFINDRGYRILRHVDVEGKVILELGPGIISHLKYFSETPSLYIIADIKKEFLEESSKILREKGMKVREIELTGDDCGAAKIPLEDGSVDIVLSFYQLEHVFELDEHVKEIKRVLRKKGLFVGAIPSEGGILWGLGRALTTRRQAYKLGINYDKVICWEHPNFCDKIINTLDREFTRITLRKFPISFLPYDLSLIISFIYRRD